MQEAQLLPPHTEKPRAYFLAMASVDNKRVRRKKAKKTKTQTDDTNFCRPEKRETVPEIGQAQPHDSDEIQQEDSYSGSSFKSVSPVDQPVNDFTQHGGEMDSLEVSKVKVII